jgi:hypothetical protein
MSVEMQFIQALRQRLFSEMGESRAYLKPG